MGSASSDRYPRWTVYDGVKVFPSTPEALIAAIDAAVTNLEYSRATATLDSSRNADESPEYDVHAADEAYKAGCAAMAAGKLEEALQSLNLSLSKCPPDKTSAISKLHSLISLASKQLEESSNSS